MTNTLQLYPASERPELLATPVLSAVKALSNEDQALIQVAEIDPAFSDTEVFCEHFEVDPDQTANTVIVEALRGGVKRLAVVVMVASGRADLNGIVRKTLGARRISLAPRELAIIESEMEYGGITALGLPQDWPLILDAKVLDVPSLTMGSGLRRSKIFFPGRVLAGLPQAQIIHDLAR